MLTLSAMQIKSNTFANSLNPVTSRLVKIYTACNFVFGFDAIDMSKFKAGRGHLRNVGVKGLRSNVYYGRIGDSWLPY